jgi:hypothetical protein
MLYESFVFVIFELNKKGKQTKTKGVSQCCAIVFAILAENGHCGEMLVEQRF